MSKSAQIRLLLSKNPKMDVNAIAKQTGAHPTTIYGVKAKMKKSSTTPKFPAKTVKKWGKAVKSALIPASNNSIPMSINKNGIEIGGTQFSFEQFQILTKLMK